jgi:hypothetical protein
VPTPEPPGIAKPAPALDQEAAALQQRMAEGLLCGVCRGDIKAADARLECTSLRPNCDRDHHTCVVGQFSHLYRPKEVAVEQQREAKWRCMVCSDMCAVCVDQDCGELALLPVRRSGAKAHQRHWRR